MSFARQRSATPPHAAAAVGPNLDDCTSGYMNKRGKFIHSWKRRFFVLSGARFCYYADNTCSVLLGGGMCLAASRWQGKQGGIVMTCESGRKYQLICENTRDWNMWLKAFRRAVTLSHKCIEGISIHSRKPKEKVTLADFHLLTTIGKGGFGKVLTVQKITGSQEDSGKVYAMKILKKQHVVDTRQVDSTKAERRILHNIEHPFVVKLRYAFQSQSKLYMVMDYYSGGSLYYHSERLGTFPADSVRFFAAEITLALDHLHQNGIIYRDLKLENVLLDEEGHVALTDFGLSKDTLIGEDKLASTFCGTPVYVAPEIIERNPYSFSIDWWALGIVMYELLCGRVPFVSRDRRRMFQKIVSCSPKFDHSGFTPDAKSVITGLLAKDPKHRLGCADERNGGRDGVLTHPFFVNHGFTNTAKILRKEICPPFKPPEYTCETNVKGIEARDTDEICETDICNFDEFTMVSEEDDPTVPVSV
jgi:serine/threonine protein kinase